ncbi:hypothetical protein KUTeg_000917 [Tegillarca granosa]|uniref:C1q domain-containing protein n=1 Tax=Tegillarca granosa TaxID=220873 RepID=A0ABQ9FWB3_TEGGR|nr:hypothetical protein KUTeg_000917 [Tegillarca granosa]
MLSLKTRQKDIQQFFLEFNLAELLFLSDIIKFIFESLVTEENKIAFTAGLQREETYSRLQILKFTKIITNVGGGLNASDGVFYCPEPGLYYFFVNIMPYANHVYAQIHKNDKRVVYVYTDNNGKQWKSGSNAVILRLEKGDRVSVKSHSSDRFHDNATYFTGLKL